MVINTLDLFQNWNRNYSTGRSISRRNPTSPSRASSTQWLRLVPVFLRVRVLIGSPQHVLSDRKQPVPEYGSVWRSRKSQRSWPTDGKNNWKIRKHLTRTWGNKYGRRKVQKNNLFWKRGCGRHGAWIHSLCIFLENVNTYVLICSYIQNLTLVLIETFKIAIYTCKRIKAKRYSCMTPAWDPKHGFYRIGSEPSLPVSSSTDLVARVRTW